MRQFNLKEWLDNKDMTVITRDGKSVRIICWDAPNKAFPIVGFIDGSFSCYSWDPFGYYTANHVKNNYDLFFECDKPGMFTEFERMFIECCCHTEPEYLSEGFLKIKLDDAKKLYEVAKREIDTGIEPKFTYSEKNCGELHNLNGNIRYEDIQYNMSFSDAQQYLSDRGFDTPWNDCEVFVDGRYITQTVANILAWADDHREDSWKPTERDIKDLEWCAELFKEKMGVSYHRLQALIDEMKALLKK